MSTKRRKKFGTCRFCGARVKIENMAAHEMKVQPSLVPKEAVSQLILTPKIFLLF